MGTATLEIKFPHTSTLFPQRYYHLISGEIIDRNDLAFFLVFVSALCIQPARFLGVHVMYVTQVCMHTDFSVVNRNTHTHKAGLLLSLLTVSSSSSVKLKLCFPEVPS